MATNIQISDPAGSFTELLRAMEIVGLTDALGRPGKYTLFARSDSGAFMYHIVPGTFTARELEDLFDAAAYETVDSRPQAHAA